MSRAPAERPSATLRITLDTVTFSYRDLAVSENIEVDNARLERAVRLSQYRLPPATTVGLGTADPPVAAAKELGRVLAENILVGEVGRALSAALIEAEGGATPLLLAINVDERRFRDLPWEMLAAAGSPALALDPRVQVFRGVTTPAQPDATAEPGPLRVLAVVASPDQGTTGLLDYERELSRILEAADPARRRGQATVRVLEWGSPSRIHEALKAEPFHVLHISCHADPGILHLESDDGLPLEVNLQQFEDEVLPVDTNIPLVVLAGCSTANGAPGTDADVSAQQFPGLARGLVERGFRYVIAMSDKVSDIYATDLLGRFYEQLTTDAAGDVVSAFTEARQGLEDERRQLPPTDHRASIVEWQIPALFASTPLVPVFDPAVTATSRAVTVSTPRNLDAERHIGDFVGRRSELRGAIQTLTGQTPHVLMYGLGGAGKSTVAAEVLRSLGDRAGVVVLLRGLVGVDGLLKAISDSLRTHDDASPEGDGPAWVAVVPDVMIEDRPWRERLRKVGKVLETTPVTLVFHDTEDNLGRAGGASGETTGRLGDRDLDQFLRLWTSMGPFARTLLTSRLPFSLEDGSWPIEDWRHIGPLSEMETRKLIWRLPGLDALDRTQQYEAYLRVGGHPRALEYLDALLRSGRARFSDVSTSLDRAMARRNITNPRRWLRRSRPLDLALAETLALAAADVLLDQLLEAIDSTPGARELLETASLYRLPIDPDALFQVAAVWRRKEWNRSDGGERALNRLLISGLLNPMPSPGPRVSGLTSKVLVHRWAAEEIELRIPEDDRRRAHILAAGHYHDLRVETSRSAGRRIDLLTEECHHKHLAGDLKGAAQLTVELSNALCDLGRFTKARHQCEEALTWTRPGSSEAAALRRSMGVIMAAAGDFDAAEDQLAPTLRGQRGLDERDRAETFSQLGEIALRKNDKRRAGAYFEQVLEAAGPLNDASLEAGAHFGLARSEVSGEQVLEYRRAILLWQGLDDMRSMTRAYHFLGEHLAAGQAMQAHALKIQEQIGDSAALGEYHLRRGRKILDARSSEKDVGGANREFEEARRLYEDVDNDRGLVEALLQLAKVAEPSAAEEHLREALEIASDLRDRTLIAEVYDKLAEVYWNRDHELATRLLLVSLDAYARQGNWRNYGTTRRAIFGSMLNLDRRQSREIIKATDQWRTRRLLRKLSHRTSIVNFLKRSRRLSRLELPLIVLYLLRDLFVFRRALRNGADRWRDRWRGFRGTRLSTQAVRFLLLLTVTGCALVGGKVISRTAWSLTWQGLAWMAILGGLAGLANTIYDARRRALYGEAADVGFKGEGNGAFRFLTVVYYVVAFTHYSGLIDWAPGLVTHIFLPSFSLWLHFIPIPHIPLHLWRTQILLGTTLGGSLAAIAFFSSPVARFFGTRLSRRHDTIPLRKKATTSAGLTEWASAVKEIHKNSTLRIRLRQSLESARGEARARLLADLGAVDVRMRRYGGALQAFHSLYREFGDQGSFADGTLFGIATRGFRDGGREVAVKTWPWDLVDIARREAVKEPDRMEPILADLQSSIADELDRQGLYSESLFMASQATEVQLRLSWLNMGRPEKSSRSMTAHRLVSFSAIVLTCFEEAARFSPRGHLQTGPVLMFLSDLDLMPWDRFWLTVGADGNSLRLLAAPDHDGVGRDGSVEGFPCSADFSAALRLLQEIVDEFEVETVHPGIMGLALLGAQRGACYQLLLSQGAEPDDLGPVLEQDTLSSDGSIWHWISDRNK